MPYSIRKSDGSLLVQLDDGLVDRASSSLAFVGKNVVNFGEAQNNNYLHLLENFAANSSPANQLTGQLWFDKNILALKIYDSSAWKPIPTITIDSSSENASRLGDLWYDTTEGKMYLNTGTDFSLIGPPDLNLDTDETLSANSDDLISSQKAVKTYVDTRDDYLEGLITGVGNSASLIVPPGTVFYTVRATAPSGYLLANGQSVSKTIYANLYAVLGSTFDDPSNPLNFKIPDLRGQFIRSWDNGAGIDSGRTLLSSQLESIKAHTHSATASALNDVTFNRPSVSIKDPGHVHSFVDRGALITGPNNVDSDGDYFDVVANIDKNTANAKTGITASLSGGSVDVDTTVSVTVNNTGGTETRPRNYSLNAIIKY